MGYVFAASLMGMESPPAIAFSEAEASMPAMSRTFYAENKRVRNERLKSECGVQLTYPNYRVGLRALHAAGDHCATGTTRPC